MDAYGYPANYFQLPFIYFAALPPTHIPKTIRSRQRSLSFDLSAASGYVCPSARAISRENADHHRSTKGNTAMGSFSIYHGIIVLLMLAIPAALVGLLIWFVQRKR